MDIPQFEARKREHIRHSLNSAHQAVGLSGLDQIHLVHEALPDLDFGQIQIATSCLGRVLRTPFFVAGMTAGHDQAFKVNQTLAVLCQERGWSMGVGSQRRDLETDAGSATTASKFQSESTIDSWRELREQVPNLVLFANIGISQLITAPLEKVRGLVEALRAQALVVHTNALQEALQYEGTPLFRGAYEALKRVCAELGTPVVLKETGCGFSSTTLRKLKGVGLSAIDVSGLGGTHWGRIEGARAPEASVQAAAAQTFAGWGESTAQSVLAAAQELGTEGEPENEPKSEMEIWASGGVRSGLDAAKLIALGAHRVGYAKPALEAALQGPDALRLWMETQEFELKLALFCTGTANCRTLREREGVWRIKGI